MFIRVGLLACVLALSQAACLCPPCPGTAGAAAPAAAAAAEPAASKRGSSRPVPNRLVIWDGDKVGAGQGWADCDKKPGCKATVVKAAGAGMNGGAGLKFHGEGPGWLGMGWNWFGWYPETAGTDISQYTNLTFQIRLENKSPDAAVDPAAVTALLGCSRGKKSSADAAIQKYTADFADGQWHKVAIPIADLMSGAGAVFDPGTAWEFRMSEWSASPRDFTIYVDDIAAEK
jgi:hypothetical protein